MKRRLWALLALFTIEAASFALLPPRTLWLAQIGWSGLGYDRRLRGTLSMIELHLIVLFSKKVAGKLA